MAARRPKTAKMVANPQLHQYVQQRLSGQVSTPDGTSVVGPVTGTWTGRNKPFRKNRAWVLAWSPEQIANRIKVDYPDDESMRISHEAIYQALYIQARGALKRELILCLRTGRALRAPRARSRRKTWAHVTAEALLSERPAEAEDRAVPGNWEGDLIIGLESSAIGTVVERTTRFTMLIHLPREEGYGLIARTNNGPALAGYGAISMKNALANGMSRLPTELVRSLTRKQIVITEDDIDGGPADVHVDFALDGQHYEIDLNSSNAKALRAALNPYIDNGRKTAGPRRPARPTQSQNRATYLTDVRQWARSQGHTVSDRGRVPAALLEAYAEAH